MQMEVFLGLFGMVSYLLLVKLSREVPNNARDWSSIILTILGR